MMPVVPSLAARNPNGHTEQEILSALQGHTGSRRFSFRYALLDGTNQYVRDLDNVIGGTVSQSWLADIKRTAAFTLRDAGGIDYLSDRIQPFVRLHLPPYGPKDWVEWPQGVFLLTSPERKASSAGVITREVEGFDQLQVYADDTVANAYVASAGANVIQAVTTALQSALFPPTFRITPHPGVLTVAKQWEPGTPKLRVINDLLDAINYESLSFDEEGVGVVQPYQSPQDRAEEYVYASDSSSLVVSDLAQRLDLWSVPNRWVLAVSDPDQPLITASYTNTNPASPTSTVRRGRVITDFRTEQDAVDLPTLQAKAARLAFEASQVYEYVPFSTGIMPLHSGNDVYRLRLDRLAIDAKYAETSWRMPLKAGARMEHEARRVVTV